MDIATKTIYIAMYYALESAYENTHEEVVRSYLVDANPFLFSDGDSADPATYKEFAELCEFEANGQISCSIEEARTRVRNYLEAIDGRLSDAFDAVAVADAWEDAIEQLI